MLQSSFIRHTIVVISVFFLLFQTVLAQNTNENLSDIAESSREFISHSIKGSKSNSISDMEDIEKKADEILDATSPKKLLYAIKKSLSNAVKQITGAFTGVFAIIFLSALFSCIAESFSQKNMFSSAAVLLIILITLSPVTQCIQLVNETCEKLCTFMISFIPTISAVSSAGGNTVSSSTSAVICSSALAFLQLLSSRLLIPGTKICVSLCAVSALGKASNLSGISSFIKSLCMWISGIIMTVFCGVLSLQSFIGAEADSLAMRGIKFTAAKLIPVAGGMVSESLKTVVAGAGYIKSVAGGAAIAYIIYTIMPALACVLAIKLLFYLAGLCSKLTGQKELQGYIDSASSAVNLLYAVCAIYSASFIVMLAIFIRTSVTV